MSSRPSRTRARTTTETVEWKERPRNTEMGGVEKVRHNITIKPGEKYIGAALPHPHLPRLPDSEIEPNGDAKNNSSRPRRHTARGRPKKKPHGRRRRQDKRPHEAPRPLPKRKTPGLVQTKETSSQSSPGRKLETTSKRSIARKIIETNIEQSTGTKIETTHRKLPRPEKITSPRTKLHRALSR